MFSGNSKKSNLYLNHIDIRQYKHYFQIFLGWRKNNIHWKYELNISSN